MPETTGVKKCYRCGEEKPVTEFNKCSRFKDGLQAACKSCKKDLYAEYKKNRLVQQIANGNIISKLCIQCNIEKPIVQFGIDKVTSDGYAINCKECAKKERDFQKSANEFERPDRPPDEVRCRICGFIKPVDQFSIDRHDKCGVRRECKTCRGADITKREHRKEYMRKYSYNLSALEFSKLMVIQGGRCAICGVHADECNRGLLVDHDHTKNEVRGLLCERCNVAIGMLRDDEDLAMAAAKYLRQYKTVCKFKNLNTKED
jgi:hypothetical protein